MLIPTQTKRRVRGVRQSSLKLFWLTSILLIDMFFTSLASAENLGDMVIPRAEAGRMSAEMIPASIFPHWIHRLRYRCDACHDSLFEMKLGASEISKQLMKERKSCGACHNEDLDSPFPVSYENCDRCHVKTEK
jgi:c(7)-type cytochrome triheme protein